MFRNLKNASQSKSRNRMPNQFIPVLESLEDRICPAVTMTPGPNINVDKISDNQAETTIASGPNGQFVAAVAWNGKNCGPGLFASESVNGGAWTQSIIAKGITSGRGGDDLPAASVDPKAVFDPSGQILYLTYLGMTTLMSGQSTGNNTPTSLYDTTARWNGSSWAGLVVTITGGTGNGQQRNISANGGVGFLAVTMAWNVTPDQSSTYQIADSEPATNPVVIAMSNNMGRTWNDFRVLDTEDADFPTVATGPGTTLFTGTSTGNNTATDLIDTTQNWFPSLWNNQEVVITAGTGAGETNLIRNSTADELDLYQPWTTIPDNTSKYSIKTGDASVWLTWTHINIQTLAYTIQVSGAPIVGTGTGAFISPIAITNTGAMNIPTVAVGPVGQVLVAMAKNNPTAPNQFYTSYNSYGLYGASFSTINLDTPVAVNNLTKKTKINAQPNRGIISIPLLVWDRSGKINPGSNGVVYLVYTDLGIGGPQDTYIASIASTSSGTSWGAVVQVNDPNANSQFLPWASVDQSTGFLAVSWYDARNDPANSKAQIYGTISTNGGASFLANVKIGAALSNANAANLAGSNFDYGDYCGVAFYNNMFWSAWADNSNSTTNNPDGAYKQMDVYVAPVIVANIQGQVEQVNVHVPKDSRQANPAVIKSEQLVHQSCSPFNTSSVQIEDTIQLLANSLFIPSIPTRPIFTIGTPSPAGSYPSPLNRNLTNEITPSYWSYGVIENRFSTFIGCDDQFVILFTKSDLMSLGNFATKPFDS